MILSDHATLSTVRWRSAYLFFRCFQDYIFALLTGYCDPPEGVEIADGQAYNPYFTGGALGMTQQLFNEGVEFDDGKPDSNLPYMAWALAYGRSWVSDTVELNQ